MVVIVIQSVQFGATAVQIINKCVAEDLHQIHVRVDAGVKLQTAAGVIQGVQALATAVQIKYRSAADH